MYRKAFNFCSQRNIWAFKQKLEAFATFHLSYLSIIEIQIEIQPLCRLFSWFHRGHKPPGV